MERWIHILWPSFIVAIGAEGVFFSVFDPVDLTVFGMNIPASRPAAYTIGFFAFWLLGALSSAATCWFQKRPADRPGVSHVDNPA